MRLFVAIEIPPAHRAEIERRLLARRGAWPAARWVRAEILHVTLAFLGEVDGAQVDALAGGLARGVQSVAPRRLAWTAAGAFPERGPARVLWLGLDGDPKLAAIHDAIVGAARGAGLLVAGAGAFRPHLTVARCPRPWPRAAVDGFRGAFAEPVGEPFETSEAVLFESQLGPAGPHHRAIARLPFSGTSC